MRLLRHKNGGAKADETSEICPLSFADRDSILTKKTSVWSSHLIATSVKNSMITNSLLSNSAVQDSLITGGQISDSIIACELVADYAVIKDSGVFGKSRIAHTAYLEDVDIENLTVYGDARLTGWRKEHILFDGREGYIDTGVWEKPPRILALDGLTITESVKGTAFCGCKKFEISHWLKIGDRYGKKLGLSIEQVEEIRQFMKSLQSEQQ